MIHPYDYIKALLDQYRGTGGFNTPGGLGIPNPGGSGIDYFPDKKLSQDPSKTIYGLLKNDPRTDYISPSPVIMSDQKYFLGDNAPIAALLGYTKPGSRIPFHVVQKGKAPSGVEDWKLGVGEANPASDFLMRIRSLIANAVPNE